MWPPVRSGAFDRRMNSWRFSPTASHSCDRISPPTRRGDPVISDSLPGARRERIPMINISVSAFVAAPRKTVMDVYMDYEKWPSFFPAIKAVRMIRREGGRLVLAVNHVEGPVINELLVRWPDEIELWERKRRYRWALPKSLRDGRGWHPVCGSCGNRIASSPVASAAVRLRIREAANRTFPGHARQA